MRRLPPRLSSVGRSGLRRRAHHRACRRNLVRDDASLAQRACGVFALMTASTVASRYPVPIEGAESGGVIAFVFDGGIVLFGWDAGILIALAARRRPTPRAQAAGARGVQRFRLRDRGSSRRRAGGHDRRYKHSGSRRPGPRFRRSAVHAHSCSSRPPSPALHAAPSPLVESSARATIVPFALMAPRL